MDADTLLVIGLVIGALSIPSLLEAYSSGRPPRIGALMLMTATVLLVIAVTRKPEGYSWDQVPQAFVKVIGRIVN
jgi:hypothetical protein